MNKKSLVRLSAFLLVLWSGAATLRAQEAVLATPPTPGTPPAAQTPPTSPAPPVAQTPPTAQTPRAPETLPAPPVAAFGALAPDAHGFSYFFGGDNFLGVYTEEITRENMGRFNLRDVRGVGVSRVVQDSPAGRAGLRENDVILRFDGEVVSSIRKLNRLIDEVPPEHTARLSISRNGSEQEINVKLGNRQNFPGIYRGEMFTPEQSREWQQRGDEMRRHGDELRRQSDEMRRRGEEMAKREGEMRLRGDQMRKQTEEMLRGNPNLFTMNFGASRRIGVSTSRLTKQLAEYFGVDEERGVLVSSVAENSPAARAGIRAGDVITEVDGERISQSNDISRAINRKKDGEINITIVRDKKRRTIRLMPEQSQSPNMEFFMDEMAFAPGAIHLPRININPPNVHLAPLPNISLPNINLPNINLPNMNLNINPQIITPQRLRPMKLRGGSVLL